MAEAGLRVVPLVCGRCAARMTAVKEQVVYQCRGCGSAWELKSGSLVLREVAHFSGDGDVHLPFWYASFNINCLEGCVDDSAGFMKLCGSVKNLTAVTEPPFVFIPAFTLPAQQAIRLGRNMTVRFPVLSFAHEQELPLEPVTLSEVDAPVMAELILMATMVEERRNNPAFLASFGVVLSGLRLVSLPFVRKEGNRLIQTEMNLEA